MNSIKNDILQNTNQGLDIFKTFIPDLQKNGPGRNFRAVFREDGKNADAKVFKADDGTWLYHDFVTGETLNPVDFVMKLKNVAFAEALDIIRNLIPTSTPNYAPVLPATKEFTIEPGGTFNYWFQYGDESEILTTIKKYGVLPLLSYSFNKNEKELTIRSSSEDPIFAFRISDDCYKIYRPQAKGNQAKHLWLGTKPSGYFDVFGINQLPDYSEYILIVEGLKDAIVANANGITAVGVDHASTSIKPEIADILRNKCKYPVLCFDIDNAGQTASGRAARETGFISIRLPEDLKENNGKDIADFFMQKRSKDELDRIVQETTQNAEIPAKDDRLCVEDKSKKLSQLEKVEATILENFKLRFNVVSNEIEFRAKDGSEKTYKTLNENNIYRFLLHNNINISMAKLTALLRSNFVAEYNPFNSYFTDLPSWNAKIDRDYIGDLCAYLPVKDGGRFRTQFKKALVRTIACALSDTVINKQALILVHEEQNSGKSTFIRWLCPPDLNGYIAENISTDKDSQLAVCDNLIINMDELATLSKAEINSLKSIFSKELVKVRRPYAKTATTAPRRASFFGSTNKAEFLTDETGSVRWLCFELTGKINWDYKKDFNIDDIWRQAYHLYLTGFKYELTAEEIIENGVANLQFQVNTTELELIQKHFQPGNIEKNDGFYTASDFSNSLIDRYEKIRLNLNNIGKALKLLGFQRVSKRHEKYPIKGYYFQSIINQNEVTTLPH